MRYFQNICGISKPKYMQYFKAKIYAVFQSQTTDWWWGLSLDCNWNQMFAPPLKTMLKLCGASYFLFSWKSPDSVNIENYLAVWTLNITQQYEYWTSLPGSRAGSSPLRRPSCTWPCPCTPAQDGRVDKCFNNFISSTDFTLPRWQGFEYFFWKCSMENIPSTNIWCAKYSMELLSPGEGDRRTSTLSGVASERCGSSSTSQPEMDDQQWKTKTIASKSNN